MNTTSYHVHSTYSDGKNSIEELFQKAKELALKEIGFSDHLCLSPKNLYPWAMKKENLEPYTKEVLALSSDKFFIRLGIEADFFLGQEAKTLSLLSNKSFDYIIGAVHIVDDKEIDYAVVKMPHEESVRMVKKYWKLVKNMAEAQFCDIVAHLDFYKKRGFFIPFKIIEKEVDQALLSIKKAKMAIELNTAGWYYSSCEQYPSVQILEKCRDLEIPIIVTADAHSKENLSRGFLQAFTLLKKIKYTQLVSFKKRKSFSSKFPEF